MRMLLNLFLQTEKEENRMIDQILKPISHRVAGYIGSMLTVLDMTNPDMQVVVAAIPIVLGFAVDLIIRKVW